MNTAKPLDGKRIVVTRAIDQARDIKDRLENMGAIVLLLPAVSFSEPADTAELDRAIKALESFDWILFTSANAVRFFAGRCRKLGVALGATEKPHCAAVGPATASAAVGQGLKIDYVAKEFIGTALARELSASLSGKRALLPRSNRAGHDLPDALKSAGAEVTEVMTYHTGGVGLAEPEVMDAVREARVDVVSFFSPSAVQNLRGELGPEVLSRLGTNTAMAAVGPLTAAALRSVGLPVAIQAPEATAESMAAAIQKYFSAKAASQTRSL
ncbi:MAG: uroporphyrinogen-III synthase [Acidobacteriia bacterium]|nr:uroporphyrinogen-III synthase [Terriglobia bacterium]